VSSLIFISFLSLLPSCSVLIIFNPSFSLLDLRQLVLLWHQARGAHGTAHARPNL
jgi:hypothetical protein